MIRRLHDRRDLSLQTRDRKVAGFSSSAGTQKRCQTPFFLAVLGPEKGDFAGKSARRAGRISPRSILRILPVFIAPVPAFGTTPFRRLQPISAPHASPPAAANPSPGLREPSEHRPPDRRIEQCINQKSAPQRQQWQRRDPLVPLSPARPQPFDHKAEASVMRNRPA